jgi:hypothetical protein
MVDEPARCEGFEYWPPTVPASDDLISSRLPLVASYTDDMAVRCDMARFGIMGSIRVVRRLHWPAEHSCHSMFPP